MRRLLVVLLLFWRSASFADANAVPPQVALEFLRPILELELEAAGDSWENSGNGGYLMYFECNMLGGAHPEVFLTSSLRMHKLSAYWTVYTRSADGGFRELRHENTLKPGIYATDFWLEKSAQGKAIVFWGNDRWGPNPLKWYAGRYFFSQRGISYVREETTKEKMDELVKAGQIVMFTPKVYGILLADFLRDPQAEWKLIDFKRSAPTVNDHFIAIEDAERMKGLVNFTPALAWQWHQELMEKGRSEGGERSKMDDVKIPGAEHTPEASLSTESITAPRVEKTSPLWPWLLAILALITAIVSHLRKRRASGMIKNSEGQN